MIDKSITTSSIDGYKWLEGKVCRVNGNDKSLQWLHFDGVTIVSSSVFQAEFPNIAFMKAIDHGFLFIIIVPEQR